ncbi:MAG: AAA family ATPase [Polyangiaceae bacterium]
MRKSEIAPLAATDPGDPERARGDRDARPLVRREGPVPERARHVGRDRTRARRQAELVDNSTVEGVLVALLGKDALVEVDVPADEAVQLTQAAAPQARTSAGGKVEKISTALRRAREVRHVAVIEMRIEGLDELASRLGPAAVRRVSEQIRTTLDHIAYKRGSKFQWRMGELGGAPGGATGPALLGGTAIVGLIGNPSRAPFDAASLAIDVHEAIAGSSEDLPILLAAAMGIVRGIATGERDEQGHLVLQRLEEPGSFLAERTCKATPRGKTWVAGGLYRLVRRDFRWGDAPPLALESGESREVPRNMRIYQLIRPLTRDERAAESALAPNDLVGRDAEKADLHAAYHRAVAALSQPQSSIAPSSGPAKGDLAQMAASLQAHLAQTGSVPRASGSAPGDASPRLDLRLPAPLSFAQPPLPQISHAPPPIPSLLPAAPSAASVAPLGERGSLPPLGSGSDGPRGQAGRGKLVARAVVGELGIGKTALVATFLSEIPRDARVLSIECSPVKSEMPLATLCDLLRESTGVGIDHSIEEAAAVFRGILAPVIARSNLGDRLITRLSEVATGKQGEEAVDEEQGNYKRDLLFVAVRFLLGALALEQPLVIVVDGLQWADRTSLELVQELLRREERLPILVLLLTRPEERAQPFIESLVRIELRGLTAEEQVRLVEARLGVREGVASVCAELLPRVGGNPFFLLEMIDALLERGTLEIVELGDGNHALKRNEQAFGDKAEALPSTLEQLIGDRIRELPSAEHDVVDWLAVAGGPLLEGDILSLTHLDDDEAITRLCARGLCDRKAGVVDFRHPLARDVAYNALDLANRSRMHRLLGEHLATTPLAQGLSAAIVARHLARGEAPNHAAELYLEAATAARTANQSQLAQRYHLRALSLLPSNDPRRLIAHEALEALYRHLGRRRERRYHLVAMRKLARHVGYAKWAAIAMMRTARLELDEGVLARGLPIAQRAAEIGRFARNAAIEVEALTLLSEILRGLGDTQGAIAACDRALEVSDGGKLHPRARAEVLRAKGILLRYVGRVPEAIAVYAEAVSVFRAAGARRSEARGFTALAFAMFVSERFQDTVTLCLEAIRIDLSIGGRFQIAKNLSNIGQAYARLGDTSRALSFMRRAREAHERFADQDSRADTLLCTSEILLDAGDLDAAHTYRLDAGALVAVTGASTT